jgi:hypothetical protein
MRQRWWDSPARRGVACRLNDGQHARGAGELITRLAGHWYKARLWWAPFGFIVLILALFLATLPGCRFHFSGGPGDNPFAPEIKTILVESAVNNTIITGIETEMTNELRSEFALDTRLTPVRNGGDVIFKTVISAYEDTPSTYRADGKEFTRTGMIKVDCKLQRTTSDKILWQKELTASNNYNVTDTITGTLTNRRRAISRMIQELIPRMHKSLYDNF